MRPAPWLPFGNHHFIKNWLSQTYTFIHMPARKNFCLCLQIMVFDSRQNVGRLYKNFRKTRFIQLFQRLRRPVDKQMIPLCQFPGDHTDVKCSVKVPLRQCTADPLLHRLNAAFNNVCIACAETDDKSAFLPKSQPPVEYNSAVRQEICLY